MFKEEAKASRFNEGFVRHHEDRFETNALFANVALGPCLGALPNTANCLKVGFIEAVFIAFLDDAIMVDVECDLRRVIICCSICVLVILNILKEFEYKSSFASVQALC